MKFTSAPFIIFTGTRTTEKIRKEIKLKIDDEFYLTGCWEGCCVYVYILYEIVNRYRQPDTHTHTHTDDGAREKQLKQLRELVRYKPFRSVDRV